MDDAGQPLSRFGMLWQLLWLPEKCLLPNWFGTPPQFCLVDRLPVLLVAAVILTWAAVLGWLLVQLLFRAPSSRRVLSRLEALVFSIAVGLNVLSTWVLLLGLSGVMSRLWMFTAPAIATLVVAGWLRFNSRELTTPGGDAGKLEISRELLAPGYCHNTGDDKDSLSVHWLWLGVPFVLMIVLAAMLPPLDFDVREYHLQVPKEFFLQGRITFLPHNVYGNMPMGAECSACWRW